VVDAAITVQFDRVGDRDEAYHVATAGTVERAERFPDGFRERAA